MGNPYPANFIDDSGTVRESGRVDFTDPGNQPGGSLPDPVPTTGVFTPTNVNDPAIQLKPAAGATANGSDELEWYDDAGNLLGYIGADGTILASLTGNFGTYTFRLNRAGANIQVQDASFNNVFEVDGAGAVKMGFLPTSDPAVAGQLWNSAGTLKVSAG